MVGFMCVKRQKFLLMYILHQKEFLIPRDYQHISNYENGILELNSQELIPGKTRIK